MTAQNLRFVFLSIILLFISFSSSISQDTLRGKVFDQSNLEPIQGTNITHNDSSIGCFSDASGYFVLPYSSEINVSVIGYVSQKIQVQDSKSVLHIAMVASPYELQGIVVASDPAQKEKLFERSASVGLITKRDLKRDNESIITPALNRIPGIYMHSGALNTNRITMRGVGARSPFSTNKIRAYLNEIPLTNGSGETTIEDIDLSIINRVEIIKGPSSSLYGAGLGGTIFLEAKKANYRTTRLIQSNTFGSYGLFRNTSAFRHSTDKMNLNLLYNKTNSDGYRDNNEFNRTNVMALGEFYLREKHSLTLLANYIQLKAYIPSSLDSADYAYNPRSAAESWEKTQGFEDYDKVLIGLSHHYEINKKWGLRTSIFTGLRNHYELRPFNILEEESQRAGLRSYLTYTPVLAKIKANFVVGGELFSEWYWWNTYENENREKGAILSENKELRAYVNLFFQSRFKITESFSLIAGINMNKTSYNYTDNFPENGDQSGKYGFDWIVSPRIALSYKVKQGIFIYSNVSHGFSPPGVEETLTPSGQINPEIQPETGWNYEIGFRGTILNHRFFYETSIYSMQIQNLLVARRVGEDQYVGVNAGKTAHNGIEIFLSYNIFHIENKLKLQAFANGTFTDYRFKEFVDDTEDYSGNLLTGTPKNTANAGLDLSTHPGIYANVNYLFVDKMPLRDDNSIFSTRYALLNLKAGFRKRLFKILELDVSAGINNLLDKKYASMHLINAASFGGRAPRYYYPGLPINYFGGISLSFDF